jgi:hypothetical protein
VFWISPRTNLLRKFEFPMATIRQKFPVTSLWVDFKGHGQQDQPLAFQINPRDGQTGEAIHHAGAGRSARLPGEVCRRTSRSPISKDSRQPQIARRSVVVIDPLGDLVRVVLRRAASVGTSPQVQDDDRVAILAVSKDETAVSDEKLRAAFAKHNLSIPIVRDLQQVTDQVFRVRALPTSLILGTDGTIQDYHVGYDANLVESLPQKIEKLLNGENLAQQELDAFRQEQQEYEPPGRSTRRCQ